MCFLRGINVLNQNYYLRSIWVVICVALCSWCIATRVYADDATTGMTTINVSSSLSPAEGIIIEQAPNLDFGNISSNKQHITGIGDSAYKIKDLANKTISFQVQVEISDFQALNNEEKLPVKNIWYRVETNADKSLQGLEKADIYHQPATVITSGNNNASVEESGNVSAEMVLDPRKIMLVKPDSYSATIQHTVVVGV